MINLNSYTSIQSNLFVKLTIEDYSIIPGGPYTNQILRISDSLMPFTLDSETYTGLGKLLSITNSVSELRVSTGDVTVTLSGLTYNSINEIMNSRIKGSPIEIYRILFDANTGEYLDIEGNPICRFNGIVTNYSVTEDFDFENKTSSNTLILTCASYVSVLDNKISGRKTNPTSHKKFYPTDVSMDRVPTLENTTFNFGDNK